MTKRFKIHNDTWTLEFVPAFEINAYSNFENGEILGFTSQSALQIFINEEIPASLIRTTVIHELAHAFIFSYNMKTDDTEGVCDFIGLYGDEIINTANKILK